MYHLSFRYTSRFRPMVVQEEKSTKSPMKTLGPLKGEVPSPERYLRKHSKEPKLPDSEFTSAVGGSLLLLSLCSCRCLSETQCCKQTQRMCTSRKPPLPARTDRPPMGVCTKRDVNQTKTQRKPEPACVDSNKGHRELLENSGLVPKYIKKKVHGGRVHPLGPLSPRPNVCSRCFRSRITEKCPGTCSSTSTEKCKELRRSTRSLWKSRRRRKP